MPAAALLIERARAIGSNGRPLSERTMILQALLAATIHNGRDGNADGELGKYIADQVIDVLKAKLDPTQTPPLKSPLTKLNWQRVRLSNAYWADVDARGLDLFGANLDSASLRRANLKDAVLYQASLRRTVLCGADLTNADLRGADLRGANLGDDTKGAGAIRATRLVNTKLANATYDSSTVFPSGFDPAVHAMTRMDTTCEPGTTV